MKHLQRADDATTAPQAIKWQRLGDWAKRNSSYLGVIALFAGLGMLAATQHWRSMSFTEEHGVTGIWDTTGDPVITGAFAVTIGLFAAIFAGGLIYIGGPKKPDENADEDVQAAYRNNRRVYLWGCGALMALTAFGIAYFSTVVASKIDKFTEPPQSKYYLLLDRQAMAAADGVGIPLTLAGGGVVVVNGCLYLKNLRKQSR